MKTIFVPLFTILFLFSLHAQNSWHWQNPIPSGNNLNHVAFIPPNQYIAVGDNGVILRSSDGGVSWQIGESFTKKDINRIEFHSDLIGFAVGDSGLIYKTTDGGITWLNRSLPIVEELFDIQIIDINTLWIGGASGFIRRSTNGGNSWTSTNPQFSYNIYVLDFLDANTGMFIGENGAGRRTTNGGTSWSQFYLPSGSHYTDLFRLSPTLAWAVRQDGNIAKTVDNSNWTLVSTGVPNSFYGVAFETALIGWAVGSNGRIIKTTDGGDTWNTIVSGSTKTLKAINLNNPNGGIIVGNIGKIMLYDRSSSNWSSTEYSTQDLFDVHFVNENIGWAVGDGGTVLKTTNKGLNWAKLSTGFADNLRSLFMCDSLLGWAGGVDGILLKTTNGGNNWSSEYSGALYTIKKLYFFNNSLGYLISGNSILKTTDSGSNWIIIKTFNGPINSFFFRDINNGYVVGDYGFASKTTDGGATWNDMQFSSYNHKAIYFHDNNRGFVGTQYGVLYKTTNGGSSWQLLLGTGSQLPITDIIFSNDLVGFFVSESGHIYTTNDGGLTWMVSYSGSNVGFYAAESKAGHFWAVGSQGSILHSDNSIVPVNLVSFSSNQTKNGIELRWKTTNEFNSHYYAIERKISTDEWQKIVEVTSNNRSQINEYSYIDQVFSANIIEYRLRAIDFDGTSRILGSLRVNGDIPGEFVLMQNYPNPFNPSTSINFTLPIRSNVILEVFSIDGTLVSTIVNQPLEAGQYSYPFPADGLATGTYFYKLSTEKGSISKKMILLK